MIVKMKNGIRKQRPGVRLATFGLVGQLFMYFASFIWAKSMHVEGWGGLGIGALLLSLFVGIAYVGAALGLAAVWDDIAAILNGKIKPKRTSKAGIVVGINLVILGLMVAFMPITVTLDHGQLCLPLAALLHLPELEILWACFTLGYAVVNWTGNFRTNRVDSIQAP